MNGRIWFYWFSSLCSLCLCGESVWAHPVPNSNHDRAIAVHLSRNGVAVDYRLEVSQETAALELVDRKGVDDLDKFYQAYLNQQEPAVAFNLDAKLDGKPLDFAVGDKSSYDKAANVYTFHFKAPWRLEPGSPHHFTLREANYDLDDFSAQRLTLRADDTVRLSNVAAPDETLMAHPGGDRKPGDGERLRKVSADVRIAEAGEAAPPPAVPADKPAGAAVGPRTLLDLLLNNGQGLIVLLFLAAAFGAIHALTPGHGKAMVAAYLVGEHGTVGHAVLLGVVVTFTHTVAVLLIAALLLFLPDKAAPSVGRLLGLVGGLLVAGLGFFLLYRRLTGGHDHFHIGGGHHHHHGHDHDHHHHDHDHEHFHEPHVRGMTAVALAPAKAEQVGWWRLIVLGVSGGIVPCWDAIAMLGLAISANRLWLGLPLLLAFSAGLAGVLVAIGVGVVYARNFAGKRLGGTERLRPLFRALPLVSAAFLMVIGLWLCYGAIHS